ncbi:MAG: GIY-YIG nuclease family protein [bacterium]
MEKVAYQYKIRKLKEIEEKNKLSFDLSKVNLKNTIVRQINKPTAEKIIVEYEWLKTMPLFCRYFFGLYFIVDNVEYLGGVVVYSDEYSANKLSTWKKYGFENKIILLSRGVCLWWTPKNSASFFIKKTTNWIKNNTSYKIITATVDPAAGEIGTIYQSLNWYYVGLMNGNYSSSGKELKRFSVLINGKLRYSRSIRKEFGTMKKSIILEKYPDAVFIPQYRKRRYFYFIGTKKENDKLKKNIENIILPYPKRNENVSGLIYMITNLVNNKKYIGQTIRSIIRRIDDYKRGVGCNPYIIKAFNKYGFENFKFEVIDTASNLSELNEKEIKYIIKYNTTNRNLGYNIEAGGKNSSASNETRKKLSKAKKNIKQNKDWVNKRTEKLVKPVIKIDIINNKILNKYTSLAEAAIKNDDNLSYSQINRKCLGLSKNKTNIIYCYEEDYINNTIPKHKKNIVEKKINDFSKKELEKIYNEYKIDKLSIRELSKKYGINFSTLNTYIKNNEKSILLYDNVEYIQCKKTGKIFYDYMNKSGAITLHIKDNYPNVKIESNYIRKKIELETGKYWYDKYFDFKYIE